MNPHGGGSIHHRGRACRRSHRSLRSRRRQSARAGKSLGLILLGIGLASGRVPPARAAFEVRLTDPFGSPHLPWVPPVPFGPRTSAVAVADSDTADVGGWAAGALHAAIFGLPDLAFDAVAAERREGRWALGGDLSRLMAAGAAEWSAAIRGGIGRRLGLEIRLFRFVPGAEAREAPGLEPRTAGSLSATLAHPLRRRCALWLWARDALRSGDSRRLGLTPRAGAGVDLLLDRGVRVRAAREWTPSGASGRLELCYEPLSAISVAQGWKLRRGASETRLAVRAGPVQACAWSHTVDRSLPATSGCAVILHRAKSAGRSGTPALGHGADAGLVALASDRSPVVSRRGASPPPGSAGEPGVPAPDNGELLPTGPEAPRVPDTPADAGPLFLIGDTPVFEAEARDTLGAWLDSIEVAPAVGNRQVRPPFAAEDVDADALRRWAGLDSASAAALVGALRGGRSSNRADPVPPGSDLRGAWLAAAPYLTSRRPQDLDGVIPAGPRGLPGGSLSWRRDSRWRSGSRTRVADRVDGALRGRSRALSFALRPEAGRTATVARTAIVFETPGVRLAAGRGGDPLVWGTGLLGRQAALRLPVPKTTRGEDPMAPRAGVPAAIEPQLGGKGAFAGAQFSAAPGIRFFGGRFLRAVDGGALLLRGDWLSGMLIRARGHGPAAADLWLRRARSGEAQEFELLRDGAGEWSRGMRAARAGRWPGGGPLLWLDGQARRWSAGAPRAARSSEESWLAASSRIGMGLRGDRLAVGLSASEEARRPRSGSSAARRTRRAGGTLRGRIGEEGVARLRVDASASGRPTATGQVHGWSPWQWNHRWRARADVRAPATASAIQRFDGEWGIEAGWERSWRRQEERTDRARGSSWGGAWLGTRSGSRRWSAGLIEILSRSGLDLSPVWCAGARSRLRSGLVIAGAFDWRRGPWSVSCRALRPLLSPAGARALVHLAAGLDLERDARGIAGERAVADPAPRDADAGDGPEERRGEEVGGTSLVREKEIPP